MLPPFASAGASLAAAALTAALVPGSASLRAACAALVGGASLIAAAVAARLARAEGARAMARTLPHCVWCARPDGGLLWTSDQHFHQSPHRRRAGDWTRALHPDDEAAVLARWREALRGSEPFELAARLADGAGGFRWFLCRAAPLRGRGQPAGWVGTWTDVDARERALHALREADRRKDQFLSVLGHELRNPLAAIRNALQITQLRDASVEQTANARRVIGRQVEQMVRLIDDLLDVSRVVSGRVALAPQPTDVADALRAAVEARRAAALQRRQTLWLEVPEEPVMASADRARLEQVFVNLLGNALKYSEPGTAVRVSLAREGELATARFRDQGIGIAAQDLGRVFEPFVQLDPERARADGGLGIGLTLVRLLVELHGGSVEVASEGAGRGSEFVVRLKALPAAPAASPGPRLYRSRPRGAGQRILVVDDNVDSAQSLATLLEILGNQVLTARDGVEGLEAAEQFRPEVVLLDIGMPQMDGYEVARRLRRCEWARELLIVALTGWSHDEDRARSREAGFDHHLVKPVDPEALDALLQHWRLPRPAQATGGQARPL